MQCFNSKLGLHHVKSLIVRINIHFFTVNVALMSYGQTLNPIWRYFRLWHVWKSCTQCLALWSLHGSQHSCKVHSPSIFQPDALKCVISRQWIVLTFQISTSLFSCLDFMGRYGCSPPSTDLCVSCLRMHQLGACWSSQILVLRIQFSRICALPYFLAKIQVRSQVFCNSMRELIYPLVLSPYIVVMCP